MSNFFLLIFLIAAAKTPLLLAEDFFRLRVPTLPSSRENPIEGLNSHQTHDAMLYMVESLLLKTFNPSYEVIQNDSAQVSLMIASSLVPQQNLSCFQQLASETSYLDVFKELKHLNQVGSSRELINAFHKQHPVPENLGGFEKLYPFKTWRRMVLDPSRVKGHKRILYRSPANLGISVAQTIVGNETRETEVALPREGNSRHYSFIVYSADGLLSDESEFQTIDGSHVRLKAPYVCIACHYDSRTRTFQRRGFLQR